jgi:hypothetical protein
MFKGGFHSLSGLFRDGIKNKNEHMKIVKSTLVLWIALVCMQANAQRIKTTTATATTKFKAPKLTITLGGFKDSSFIAPQMADSIIGLPLKVVDAKNAVYAISSYQFLYKKIVVSEDENTGKAYNTTTVKSALFKASPLPTIWLNAVREILRPREELIFFDVIVKDDKGRVMYAPNLKLIVR